MSVLLSIDGPYFASGPIKFGDIRSAFGGGNNFGSYKRNTSSDATNPIVPDATENENISDDRNLRFGAFRNSVKSYTATQSGTDDNSGNLDNPGFRMGKKIGDTGIEWNNNLSKNIRKTVNITGTCGSKTTARAGAQIDPSTPVYNLTINVSGSILGAGGDGSSSGGGTNGGPALRVRSTGGKNITVNISQGAQVYGGGGGGGRGADGGKGADGICSSSVFVSKTCWCECDCFSLLAAAIVGGTLGDIAFLNYINKGCQGGADTNTGQGVSRDCSEWQTSSYSVSGAPGGTGGGGGNGQGYNHGRSNGSGGTSGTPGGCPTYGGSGEDGKAGGNGGDWGQPASDNTGQAGSAIIGIVGSGYSLNGANSSNCKGNTSGSD